jgi:hypothetical protein
MTIPIVQEPNGPEFSMGRFTTYSPERSAIEIHKEGDGIFLHLGGTVVDNPTIVGLIKRDVFDLGLALLQAHARMENSLDTPTES